MRNEWKACLVLRNGCGDDKSKESGESQRGRKERGRKTREMEKEREGEKKTAKGRKTVTERERR